MKFCSDVCCSPGIPKRVSRILRGSGTVLYRGTTLPVSKRDTNLKPCVDFDPLAPFHKHDLQSNQTREFDATCISITKMPLAENHLTSPNVCMTSTQCACRHQTRDIPAFSFIHYMTGRQRTYIQRQDTLDGNIPAPLKRVSNLELGRTNRVIAGEEEYLSTPLSRSAVALREFAT